MTTALYSIVKYLKEEKMEHMEEGTGKDCQGWSKEEKKIAAMSSNQRKVLGGDQTMSSHEKK
jgi:hypothetical protein